jgi:hypothetical protein
LFGRGVVRHDDRAAYMAAPLTTLDVRGHPVATAGPVVPEDGCEDG